MRESVMAKKKELVGPLSLTAWERKMRKERLDTYHKIQDKLINTSVTLKDEENLGSKLLKMEKRLLKKAGLDGYEVVRGQNGIYLRIKKVPNFAKKIRKPSTFKPPKHLVSSNHALPKMKPRLTERVIN